MTQRAFAKVNIFLKITGTRGQYHELASRFVRVASVYDEMRFVPRKRPGEGLEVAGEFGCALENNTLFKAYTVLLEEGFGAVLSSFFKAHTLEVDKRIPEGAGLGGGSSNAATFLLMCNRFAGLGLDTQTLATLGQRIGADVPFFIHETQSANVQGIGEIIEPFDEEVPELELFTPPVFCATPKVYGAFRDHFLHRIDLDFAQTLLTCKSKAAIECYEATVLNDLLAPALLLYPALGPYMQQGWKMSGSGSTLFRIKNHG